MAWQFGHLRSHVITYASATRSAAATRVTRLHADPHRLASICKVGRDHQIDLLAEGAEGLRKMGAVADQLMLRTGGCSGCQLSGSCTVCRPQAKLYQLAKAPLVSYCQAWKEATVTAVIVELHRRPAPVSAALAPVEEIMFIPDVEALGVGNRRNCAASDDNPY